LRHKHCEKHAAIGAHHDVSRPPARRELREFRLHFGASLQPRLQSPISGNLAQSDVDEPYSAEPTRDRHACRGNLGSGHPVLVFAEDPAAMRNRA